MSANPTRVDWDATTDDPGSPLQEGNRVLESIARREALRALLAFSDLHERIRIRRLATGCAPDQDLFETERFILDEVLQLICDRAQAVTHADGIVIALAAESAERPEMVCRASAGPLTIERGVRLIGESEFLQDCLESGRILRCDDCEIDARVELDYSRVIGTRSTVLVPLRGRHAQLGVLQAFSSTPWAFTDHDIRCFDLFAELVLSALRPEDQDRRILWLSDVAGEVLQAMPAVAPPLDEPSPVPALNSAVAEVVAIEIPKDEPGVEPVFALSPAPEIETAPHAAVPIPALVPELPPEPAPELAPEQAPQAVSELEILAPVAIPSAVVELPESDLADGPLENVLEIEAPVTPTKARRFLPALHRLALRASSRPGLNVVMGLVAVAALFSAGAWWGMVHGRTAATTPAAANTAPPSVTAPPAPPADGVAPAVSDNLMNPESLGSDVTLRAVPENKLAALPRITGVRHWSSSTGSTVVIDMQDQVPYEVHRLMSPERIYFDLHDTVLPADLQGKTMDVGDASLTRVRVAQPVAGVTRVVLDTKDGSNFSVSMESNPYRLVVELHGSDKNLVANRMAANMIPNMAPNHVAPAAPVKTPPLAASATASSQPVPAKTGKFRIVLDAGHGGWDLGTVGRQGLLEKDLVLDVTQRLGKLLQTRLGSEVMFTRTGDTYLPLDQRADIANQAQADLFVSVHANYSSSAAARGIETYYTNVFSAPGAHEVEKHDDGSFAKLTPISLSGAALHEKIEESQRLAASVQRSLYATLSASSPDIRNRGIKDSAFAVLTGTTMPAILTEISFVSSPTDEHNLQSAAYRQQIAEALYQGIARYQQSSPRAKVAQLQTAAARR
jgi:N-acetylmuramoyl-L-alanine amidase